ncbi:GNAT family N-acetyltransferase [Paucibacter sp. APW11]|uniref:GNAT family N-acetyltransferase n=1 Tax=Roseateles aquae TaxID=3077235 RepID=A0ABU3PFU9_9BURK|nr:GNAT family N-acetyltransferase [Paucibacter sp. APW11]MDT9001379.1 GNAT family N-acetyltransferase [Paucibacter sp. APW11]
MEFTIRRPRPDDAADFVRLMSSPEVYGNLLQMPHPSEELWRQRLSEQLQPGKPDLHLVAVVEGRVMASAGLHPAAAALRRRHAMSLGISVAPEAQGHGLGSALLGALIDYADNWAQVLRLELEVYCDNDRAVRLYQRFGFEIEGRMRRHALRAGQYVDSFGMARLHPRPPALQD